MNSTLDDHILVKEEEEEEEEEEEGNEQVEECSVCLKQSISMCSCLVFHSLQCFQKANARAFHALLRQFMANRLDEPFFLPHRILRRLQNLPYDVLHVVVPQRGRLEHLHRLLALRLQKWMLQKTADGRSLLRVSLETELENVEKPGIAEWKRRQKTDSILGKSI